jgi:hypothetical protein
VPDAYPHRFGYSVVFRKAPPAYSLGDSCPDIAGFGGIWSCAPVFSLTVWFQSERFEALQAINIMEHVLIPCASGECHGGRDLWTSDGGSSLCGEEELSLLIHDLEQRHVSGGECTGEV